MKSIWMVDSAMMAQGQRAENSANNPSQNQMDRAQPDRLEADREDRANTEGTQPAPPASAGSASDGSERDNGSKDDQMIIVTGELSNFGALKSSAPIVETARSISLETSEDFADKGFETLDDALGYMAGVTAEPFGFSTRGDFSRVRGLDAPEYRDNLQFLFGFYNNPRPDLYTLEQVEVLKGPASVLYGSGSPGGIINVVTKRPHDRNQAEVKLQAGSFDRFEIAGDANLVIPGTDGTGWFRLTALYRDSGTQIDEVNDEKIVIAPAFTANPADGTKITFLFNYTEQNTDTAHQFYPVYGTFLPHPSGQQVDLTEYFGEPGFDRYDSRSTAVTVIGEQRLTNWLDFEAVARYVDVSSDYNQSWLSSNGNGVPRTDNDGNGLRTFYVSDRRSEQHAFDTRLRANFTTGAIEHDIVAGLQYQHVVTDADNAFVRTPATINVFEPVYGNGPSIAEIKALQADGPRNYVREIGYYYSHQLGIGPFELNGGVRFDDVDNRVENGSRQSDTATSFSGGALYRGPFGLSPYFSYAESFEPVVGLDSLTNEQLLSQRGRQYEAGVKWQPPGIAALVTLAAFDIKQSNLANPNALAGANNQQQGDANIRGIELEANIFLGGLKLDGNFSYLDTEDVNGLDLTAIAAYNASLFGIYRFDRGILKGLRFGGGVRHVGASSSADISALTGDLLNYRVDSYTVGDLVIGYAAHGFDLSLNARNFTNEKYLTTCLVRGDCYPGERASWFVNLAYQF